MDNLEPRSQMPRRRDPSRKAAVLDHARYLSSRSSSLGRWHQSMSG